MLVQSSQWSLLDTFVKAIGLEDGLVYSIFQVWLIKQLINKALINKLQFLNSGLFCIIWSVFWTWLAASEPRLHSSVNREEMWVRCFCVLVFSLMNYSKLHLILRLYIERDKSAMSLKHQNATPWREILTSKEVWSVIIVKFGVDYVFWLLMLNLPQYLHNVLHLRLHQVRT